MCSKNGKKQENCAGLEKKEKKKTPNPMSRSVTVVPEIKQQGRGLLYMSVLHLFGRYRFSWGIVGSLASNISRKYVERVWWCINIEDDEKIAQDVMGKVVVISPQTCRILAAT
jgi:hypothetical protein